MLRQQGLHEEAAGMVAEVGRNVTHPQPAPGTRRVVMRPPQAAQGLTEAMVVLFIRSVDFLGAEVGVVVEHKQVVAIFAPVLRHELERLAVPVNGFGLLPLQLQTARQRAHTHRVLRIDRQHLANMLLGFHHVAGILQNQRQVVQGLNQVRLDRQRLAVCVRRLLRPTQLTHAQRQLEVEIMVLGLVLQGIAVGRFGLLNTPLLEEHLAQPPGSFRHVRQGLQGPPPVRFFLNEVAFFCQQQAQILIGLGKTGLHLQRPLVERCRLRQLALPPQHIAQVVQHLEVFGRLLNQLLVAAFGLLPETELLVTQTQVEQRLHVVGQQLHRTRLGLQRPFEVAQLLAKCAKQLPAVAVGGITLREGQRLQLSGLVVTGLEQGHQLLHLIRRRADRLAIRCGVAPLLEHELIGLLGPAGKGRLIHHHAGLHLRAQARTRLGQLAQIGRQRNRLGHVLFFALRNPFLVPHAVQDRAAQPSHTRPPGQRDVGHAHVQALEQRCARVVREAVQPDVHAAQHVPRRAVESDLQPAAFHAMGLEFLDQRFAHAFVLVGAAVDHQARARHALEDLRPHPYRSVVDADGACQGAEGHMAALQCRQGAHLTHVQGRPVGVRAVRHPPGRLGKQVFAAHRGRRFVGQKVVDRLQARGVAKSQPAHRHRRRLARKRAKTATRSMAGEVHQDIDAIGADALGQGLVAHASRGDPVVHIALVALRHLVFARQRCIGKDFDNRPVMLRQQGFHEVLRRVGAEIR